MKKQKPKQTKKTYVTPRLTTHGDAAKLTLCQTVVNECHSHLPVIPTCSPSRHR